MKGIITPSPEAMQRITGHSPYRRLSIWIQATIGKRATCKLLPTPKINELSLNICQVQRTLTMQVQEETLCSWASTLSFSSTVEELETAWWNWGERFYWRGGIKFGVWSIPFPLQTSRNLKRSLTGWETKVLYYIKCGNLIWDWVTVGKRRESWLCG